MNLRFWNIGFMLFIILLILPMTVRGNQEMNLTINIYYTGTDGNARKFAEEMEKSSLADRIRQATGNLKYEYFYPVNDPETVLLIVSWDNQEALDKHHASEIMQRISELRNKYDLHMRVERYVPDGSVPLSDAQFIRK